MKPGVYKDIPEAEYHALPFLNASTIKRFATNPLASQMPFEPSASLIKTMQTGSATHKLALEGVAEYLNNYVIAPEIDKRTKEGKAQWQGFLDNAGSRELLDSEQGIAVEGMAKSLKENPASKIMLNRGCNEVTVIWVDEESGLTCKARIDDYYNSVAMDLKTCGDVQWFHKDIWKYNYHLQAVHYSEGLEATGNIVDGFVFIAVQSSAPYPVRVGMLTQDHYDAARAEWRRLVNLYKQCRDSNYWPNFKIPGHIYELSQITSYDLMEEF